MTKAKAIEILNQRYDEYVFIQRLRFSDESDVINRMIALLTAIDALEQDSSVKAEPDNGWISVKDRMPEEDKSILCCVFGRRVGEGVYRGFDGKHHVWDMYAVSGTYWDNEVTHWMPLPEPPESEDDAE